MFSHISSICASLYALCSCKSKPDQCSSTIQPVLLLIPRPLRLLEPLPLPLRPLLPNLQPLNMELKCIRRAKAHCKRPRQVLIHDPQRESIHLRRNVQPRREAYEDAQHLQQCCGGRRFRRARERKRGLGGAGARRGSVGERTEQLRGDGEGWHFEDRVMAGMKVRVSPSWVFAGRVSSEG
jgi:hypothetical protein